jgi:hypothetical protein
MEYKLIENGNKSLDILWFKPFFGLVQDKYWNWVNILKENKIIVLDI